MTILVGLCLGVFGLLSVVFEVFSRCKKPAWGNPGCPPPGPHCFDHVSALRAWLLRQTSLAAQVRKMALTKPTPQ